MLMSTEQLSPSTEPSLADLLRELAAAGYDDDFRAEADGLLRASRHACLHAPAAMRIDRVHRFEGVSDPDDEMIVFALTCREHGVKGTYVVPYGPSMAAIDAEMVRRLDPDHQPHKIA